MNLASARTLTLVTAFVLAACGGGGPAADSGSPLDSGGGAADGGDAGAADTGTADVPASSTPSCADFGGTCTATATESCAAGTTPVLDGSDTLCQSSTRTCCVPVPAAGTLALRGDYGLACTSSSFSEFTAGTCGGATCAVGCECTAASGAMCDCSRGAPPTHDGMVNCALFNCGVSTCAFGCHCADAMSGACVCP